jgi:hypothetical protein
MEINKRNILIKDFSDKQKELYRINVLLKIFVENQKQLSKFIKDVKLQSYKNNLISRKDTYKRYINYLHYKKNNLEGKKQSHKKYNYEYSFKLFDDADLKTFQILYSFFLIRKNNTYEILDTAFLAANVIFERKRLTLSELKNFYFLIEDDIISKINETKIELSVINDMKEEANIAKEKIYEEYSPIIENIKKEYDIAISKIKKEREQKINNTKEIIFLNKRKTTFDNNTLKRDNHLKLINKKIIQNELRQKKFKKIL